MVPDVEQRLEALEQAMESKTAEIETMYLFWAGTLVFSMQACMLGAATIATAHRIVYHAQTSQSLAGPRGFPLSF